MRFNLFAFSICLALIISSCTKQNDAITTNTEETKYNHPADSLPQLNDAEKLLVGTWICTEFPTERFNADTNYLVTYNRLQGIRIRTVTFKPDKSYKLIDSFVYDIQHKIDNKWFIDSSYLSFGEKQKTVHSQIIVKLHGDSMITNSDFVPAGSGDVNGFDKYFFKYRRQ